MDVCGKMIGSRRQALVVLGAMAAPFVISLAWILLVEGRGNVKLAPAGISQVASATNPGGNLEGKDLRLGVAGSALNAAAITGTSTGMANSAHESYTPIGGVVPLFNMMLGEVISGGTGTGLYGMLLFVLISVFIAGLMVGRTPIYLGKRILTAETRLAAVYILVLPVTVVMLSSIAILEPSAAKSVSASGPHGLPEVVYAHTSTTHNNGSALAETFGRPLAGADLVGRLPGVGAQRCRRAVQDTGGGWPWWAASFQFSRTTGVAGSSICLRMPRSAEARCSNERGQGKQRGRGHQARVAVDESGRAVI
ncbi:potassium-transporting ATPase subunit KdpA [Streptomyces sp. NPDC088353]|uniref:potassium-transporting ATPase subunit KdpA n=1 Tax=Streptomyces sp. NPDC088353 TaxID=3365855 RepID=UPI0037FE23FA